MYIRAIDILNNNVANFTNIPTPHLTSFKMAESTTNVSSDENLTDQQNSVTAGETQSNPNLFQGSSQTPTIPLEQEVENENYLEGPLDIDEKRKRFDETSCTVEEKELSDLFRKGLLDDGSTGPLKGDFTLNDLPQLSGDEACSVQWMTSKRKPKEKTSNGARTMAGLSDDELASVLQACPDLEDFITKKTQLQQTDKKSSIARGSEIGC
ncbi:hypothetical protein V8C35DRAFT_286227 [Trichoderma chlorosporum]